MRAEAEESGCIHDRVSALTPQCAAHEPGPSLRPGLLERARDVLPNGLDRDAEFVCDLAVCESLRKERQDAELSRRQGRECRRELALLDQEADSCGMTLEIAGRVKDGRVDA